ncbi:D-aminopeptidase [Sinirhodobacter huangdaonensis]|uniref:D-aminopeptidase n=1 Tax=Paenirhodobacter huangdaonensis TaxID=2501515 RepID=A0A443LJZ6_9RHOB|nr:D-aminopeptidase [Sinirhodobacter huangdaonensis]RWR49506.1 D-aminopeptidase [Sinirhodobacter huangdaonensis]
MSTVDMRALERALDLLPDQYRGPAGVAGVVHRGRVIARRAWGYADTAARMPMTAGLRMPICSISKQMTCALLLDLFADPEVLAPRLAELLPRFRGALPSIAHLCHNQSGLRDYWALTVLHGAAPEGRFTAADGLTLLAQAEDGQFPPGTQYSYSNGNFRLLAELIVRATGRDFGTLLDERIFRPAKMATACLAPDMATRPDGVVGYEGNDEVGFLPAQSALTWFGDSGVSASLEDMLAWEQHIDATRDDPRGLYNRISAPVSFADGTAASYGYGLRRYRHAGRAVTAHGGGVRGFCSYRLHLASERLSVVVLFNHEASAMRAAEGLMTAALGAALGAAELAPLPRAAAGEGWNGLWFDHGRDLFLRTRAVPGGVRLHYAVSPVVLPVSGENRAEAPDLALRREGDFLLMERRAENLTLRATRLEPLIWADAAEISGRYHSDALGAVLEIEARDGAASIGFEGMLGAGPMERMYPLARDLWAVTSRRAMDAAPPGEWTLRIHRDAAGRVEGLTLGCWLARGIAYRRLSKP